MKPLIVVGGVAAEMSAASKARRLKPDYSNCDSYDKKFIKCSNFHQRSLV
jgi:hypothetical protein